MIKNNEWITKTCENMPKEESELLKRAYKTIMDNVTAGDEMPWKPYRCIIPGTPQFYGIWNWDTAFHVMTVSRWDTELAKECILGFMKFQKEDGMLPDVIRIDGSIEDRLSKPPVMPWATEIVYKRCHDKDFIKTLYPKFEKNEQWWLENRCSKGLFYYSAVADKKSEEFETLAGWESGWDNSPRWDSSSVSDLWTIDLNCYMVLFYRSMQFFSNELGLNSEAVIWGEKERMLVNFINNKLWSEEKQYYADANRLSGEISDTLTPASFMPLFIGIAPDNRAKAMNDIAKDKSIFDCKMPTVSYDNPAYSKDYWRGPIWLNVAYFVAKGLENYRFDTADKIKKSILQCCEKEKNGIYENYDSVTRMGMGCGCFSWSSAFIIEFILDF